MCDLGSSQIQLLRLGEKEVFQASIKNERLNRLISEIYFEIKGIYGAPKIHKIRVGRSEILSLKRGQKLM